jgi:hypothetical protein
MYWKKKILTLRTVEQDKYEYRHAMENNEGKITKDRYKGIFPVMFNVSLML